MASAEIAATAIGRNSAISTDRAASAAKRPLLVIDEKKSGPPRPSLEPSTLTEMQMITGRAASTAMPAQFRRRPKIMVSSERSRRASAIAPLTADIEALPGERDEQVLQTRRLYG